MIIGAMNSLSDSSRTFEELEAPGRIPFIIYAQGEPGKALAVIPRRESTRLTCGHRSDLPSHD